LDIANPPTRFLESESRRGSFPGAARTRRRDLFPSGPRVSTSSTRPV